MKSIFDFTGNVTAGDIERFIEKGVDPNVRDDKGRAPIMMAACFGYHSAADALIKAGADINAQDNHGNTALMLAAYAAIPSTIDKILSYHPDLNIKDSRGGSALTAPFENAARTPEERQQVVEILLKAGAVPDNFALSIPGVRLAYERNFETSKQHSL